MMKTRFLPTAAMCAAFFAMTVICVGCNDNKPAVVGGGGGPRVNYKGRTCPANATPEDYAIEVVATQDVFKDPANNAIVVCEGDKVSWFIQTGNGVIAITFTDPYANDLFGQPSLQSHSSGPKNETDQQTVKSQNGHRGQVYKYTIVVKDSGQSFKKDPHVIPMGGGG
jgi:hypothetical protein